MQRKRRIFWVAVFLKGSVSISMRARALCLFTRLLTYSRMDLAASANEP